MTSRFDEHFAALPIMTILRGIAPEEVEGVARVLLDEGIRLIEIPLGFPHALDAIARLAAFAGGNATIGAGTVTTQTEVREVIAAGGELIVSPHCDPSMTEFCIRSGGIAVPGVRTATEAFRAIGAGARILKFFPATVQTAPEIGALKTVLPSGARILAVGGVSAANASVFRDSGADGLGVGSFIFKPGKGLGAVRNDTRDVVESWSKDCGQ